MNFAVYTVTVNAPSIEASAIRAAIESCGLYIFNLTGVRPVGNGTFECFGCFIKQGRQALFFLTAAALGALTQGRGEISIIPPRQKKVNRHFAQTFNPHDPEICAVLPLADFKKFCYNVFTR